MSTAMSSSGQIRHRRAIEALRSGVPNRDAVKALGSSQPQIEERFAQQLQAAKGGFATGRQAPGLLIAGDFGSGKSHLLEYFQHLALEANFVCSKVVISKETPLFDASKLYRAAIQAAVVPGKRGFALNEVAESLGSSFNSPAYANLYKFLNGTDNGFNSRFPATLFLYERITDAEIRNRIISFWAGDPIGIGDLRSWLRGHGEAATYNLEKISAADLAVQRFRFAPRLMIAAGYAGWILLVDEVELIGRYSFRQRARSYAELARWAGKLEGQSYPGLYAVFAITSDFVPAVLEVKNDAETIPGKLRASGLAANNLLASQAERGVRLISGEAKRLKGLDAQEIDHTRELVREIHALAYGWEPPSLEADQRLSSTSMRQYVRRWINEWDLRRLDPDSAVTMVVSDLALDYQENPDFEIPTEGDVELDS